MVIGPSHRLQHARELSGLSARRLGTLAGLSTATVALIESGERKAPSAETLARLAKVLGVSLDWLISGAGDPPDEATVRAAVAAAHASGSHEESA